MEGQYLKKVFFLLSLGCPDGCPCEGYKCTEEFTTTTSESATTTAEAITTTASSTTTITTTTEPAGPLTSVFVLYSNLNEPSHRKGLTLNEL